MSLACSLTVACSFAISPRCIEASACVARSCSSRTYATTTHVDQLGVCASLLSQAKSSQVVQADACCAWPRTWTEPTRRVSKAETSSERIRSTSSATRELLWDADELSL
jgi:hypothetical protein